MKIFQSKITVFGIPSRIVPGPRRAPGGTAWRPGPGPGAGKLEDSSTFSPSGSGRPGSPGAKCSPKRTRGGPTKDPRKSMKIDRNPYKIDENRWKSMKIDVNQWKSMQIRKKR